MELLGVLTFVGVVWLFLHVAYAVSRMVTRVLTGRRPWWKDD